MKQPINNSTNETYLLSNKHLKLLDNIFKKQLQSCNLSELQIQIQDWAQTVLSDEQKEWSELRTNSIDALYRLDKKEEAQKRAKAKNKRYEPFKKIFKQLQQTRFKKYQAAGKILSANGFVKWFLEHKATSINIPYLESNQTNQLIKLAQFNNREFKKLSNAEADTSLTKED